MRIFVVVVGGSPAHAAVGGYFYYSFEAADNIKQQLVNKGQKDVWVVPLINNEK